MAAEDPTSDERLAAVTIGERNPHDAPIELAEYDDEWPVLFEREASRIRDALGARVMLLEHAGSTSVPGLAAKPIIDVVLAVADSSDEAAYVPALEAAGYVLRIREPEWYEHRLLRRGARDVVDRPDRSVRTADPAGPGGRRRPADASRPGTNVNLHVFSVGSGEIERMLGFRDRLRASDEDRELYEATKRALAARTWRHVQDYADAKADVVEAILARAARDRG